MDLSELRVVSIQPHEEAHFQSLLDEHHYLGAAHKIGESAFYAVQWRDQWVALSVFSSCALKSRVRDEWIGWQRRESFGRLHLITCQSRFLILESVPNLASRSLALLARRVAADWPLRFGHPVVLLETFVDPGRFKGSCYVAAGWLNLGHTRGFAEKAGATRAVQVRRCCLYARCGGMPERFSASRGWRVSFIYMEYIE